MADISAAMVKQLRDRTGQAMMDCKKALTETNGDMEKAVDLLRKKGMAVMDKRQGKETKEGRVFGQVTPDGKVAVLASLCSETDFTAKNENFQAAVQKIGKTLLNASENPADAAAFGQMKSEDGQKVDDIVNDLVSQTGEKITLGPFYRYELQAAGLLHCYIHFNNKIGTLLQIDAESDATAACDVLKTLAADLAMHITAVNPMAVSEDALDPEEIEREKEVARGQVKGKPENMVEKIVDGKINKWYQQVVLLHQPFVKDDSKTVTQLLEEVGKAAGGAVTVKQFARLQIG